MDYQQVKRGFACGSNAADAARKNHEFGTAHKFTSESGARAGRLGAERRWGERRAVQGDPPAGNERRQGDRRSS